MIPNFGFLDGGRLAGSAHPGRGRALHDALHELSGRHGITAIVTLHPDALPSDALAEFGMAYHHLAVGDFDTPGLKETAKAVAFARERLAAGARVLVHCGAGYGRTGTLLACCLVAEGLSAARALGEVRRCRPGSVENAKQEEFVREWAAWCRQAGARERKSRRRDQAT